MRAQMLNIGSSCINQIGRNWSEQTAFYRFMNNDKVTESSLLSQCLSQQDSIDQEEELLVIQDTSQINLNHLQKSIKDKEGLGVLNDGLTLGYYFHGSLVLNKNYDVKGISDVIMYGRPAPSTEESQYVRSRRRDNFPIEEKESYRWLLSVRNSTKYLKNPDRLTFISDREGDIYEVLDQIDRQGSKFIIRSQHNRKINLEDDSNCRLKEFISTLKIQKKYRIKVPADDRGNKMRSAKLNIRYSKIKLSSPTHYGYETDFSSQIECYVVNVFEEVKKGEKAPENLISWTILTNRKVENVKEAQGIIKDYRNRWPIEDVFRGMKNKGMQIDSATLKSGKALRKLAIMGFDISAIALKLRQAREGKNHIPVQEVFDEKQIECMDQLCSSLEGNTQKLKNPHSKNSLAWAAWIIARLGGWKGYKSQRPPGIITMKRGLIKFMDLFMGWSIKYPE